MEDRVGELERRMDEVVRLLRDGRKARSRGRSPPRRGPHRVDSRDRWNEGSRRERDAHHRPPFRKEEGSEWSHNRTRPSSPHSRNGSSSHRDYSSWRSRPPNSSHRSPSDRQRFSERKMELPIFSGEDALGWLLRIESYFTVNGIEGDERMELVLVALEGKGLSWYRAWEDQVAFPSWNDFREALLRRFQPGVVKDPFGPLLRVKQMGSVMDYIELFEQVSGPMRHIDKEMLKGIFINGLRPELQAEIKSLDLWNLSEIKDRALMLEERNREWRGSGAGPLAKGVGPNRGPNQFRMGPGGNRVWENKGKEVKPNVSRRDEKGGDSGGRLSQEELQERSRKGLCFKCGEKWGHDHVCKMKNYKLVMVEDSEVGTEEEGEDEAEEENATIELKSLQLSLRSFAGLTTTNKSFKVLGRIKDTEVVILVDTGATNSFISKKKADEMELRVTPTRECKVELGTGQEAASRGVCEGV